MRTKVKAKATKEDLLIEKFNNYLSSDINNTIIVEELPLLLKSYSKTLKRVNRVIKQSDQQQLETIKLGETLEAVGNKVKNLLNNAGQGFLSFKNDMLIDSEYSKECENLIEPNLASKNISELLFVNDMKSKQLFESILKDISNIDDNIIIESLLTLLPEEITINRKIIKLEYKFLAKNSFMLILTNITAQKKLEEKIKEDQQILKMIVTLTSESDSFFDAWFEYKNFAKHKLDFIKNDRKPYDNLNELYRIIHTFKGTFSQLFMKNSVERLHIIESKLSNMLEENNSTNDIIIDFLQNINFEQFIEQDIQIIKKVLGDSFLYSEQIVKVKIDDINHIKQELSKYQNEHTMFTKLLLEIDSWQDITIIDILNSYSKLVDELSMTLNKAIYDLNIDGDKDLKVPLRFKPFLKSLVHVFRNVVDHGIETPEERLRKNKDEIGTISCSFKTDDENFILIISDDGAGINKEKVINKLKELGESTDNLTDNEIFKAIFNDNFSTKSIDELSDISGRGVGMSAVKNELELLNAIYSIETEKDKGTTFKFIIPLFEKIELF